MPDFVPMYSSHLEVQVTKLLTDSPSRPSRWKHSDPDLLLRRQLKTLLSFLN